MEKEEDCAIDLLRQLDCEIAKLPFSERAAFCQAVDKMTIDWVASEADPGPFLTVSDNNAALAAKRLTNYWTLRLETFGLDRCFRSIDDRDSGNGVLDSDMLASLDSGVIYLLPPDKHGHMVIYCPYSNAPKVNKKTGATLEKRKKALFYFLHLISKYHRSISPGFILVQLIQEKQHQPSPGTYQFFQRAASQCFPVCLQSIHMVVTPWLPQKNRARYMGRSIPYIWQVVKSTFYTSTKRRSVDYIESDRNMAVNKHNIASILTNRIGLRPDCLPKEGGGVWTYQRFKEHAHDLKMYATFDGNDDNKDATLPDCTGATHLSHHEQSPLNLLAEAASLMSIHQVCEE